MKQTLTALLFSFYILLSSAGLSLAQGIPHVQGDFVSPYTQVKKGETFYIGFYTEIENHWHTYWKNPGDSGLETRIDFTPIDGVTIGDIIWPTPKKIPYQGLVNYGYEGEVLYFIPVTIDPSYQGSEITLQARADWLVCKEICIPEGEDYLFAISVGDRFEAGVNETLFKQFQEKLPQPFSGKSTASLVDGNIVLTFSPIKERPEKAWFFPDSWGVLNYEAPQKMIFDNQTLILTVPSPADILDKDIKGVLDLGEKAFSVEIVKTAVPAVKSVPVTDVEQADLDETTHLSLGMILFYAFVGGLILNLMPCVFPVLSLKAMSLVGHAEKQASHIRKQSLLYLGGVVLSFVFIGSLLLVLQALGHEIGWGFQLQSPIFTSLMAVLFFVIGMNLTGFFEVGTSLMGFGSKKADKEQSSFLTGVLAVVVATPCTAPFMATALGAVLWLGAVESLLVFVSLGVGLAFPYVLISFMPRVVSYLPRPGAWMETFKQFLSFPMFASAIWLLYVVLGQAGSLAVLATLSVSFLVVFVLWLLSKPRHLLTYPIVFLVVSMTLFVFHNFIIEAAHEDEYIAEVEQTYIEYDEESLERLLANNRPVFVNMTADWCITCLANERIALSQDVVEQAFLDKEIVYMKGDWTRKDDHITRFLKKYERNGVPLYVYYNEKGEEYILPQLLTAGIILEILEK